LKKQRDRGPGRTAHTKSTSATIKPDAPSRHVSISQPHPKDKSTARNQTKSHLTNMQKKMKQNLDGARFRWINESLYKSESSQAQKTLKNDPTVYEAYHAGFRHQVTSWPSNPVNACIDRISRSKRNTVVADLGCGDAALAKALVPKGFSVISFDLVSDGAFVVEADICKHLPLPGCESSKSREVGGQIVDVVVCSLSLMNTNWVGCVREAWRILKPAGRLLIAEVTSRFTDVEQFVSLICLLGFQLQTKDNDNTHFTLFDFIKTERAAVLSEEKWQALILKGKLLQPCEYKRRFNEGY